MEEVVTVHWLAEELAIRVGWYKGGSLVWDWVGSFHVVVDTEEEGIKWGRNVG